MNNIFYDPEKFGLEIFDHIEDDNASYSFDDFVIFKNKDGKLFYLQDSGCSCPTPFDGMGIDDLTEINDINQLEIAIDEYRGDDPDRQCCSSERKQEVLRKVNEALK